MLTDSGSLYNLSLFNNKKEPLWLKKWLNASFYKIQPAHYDKCIQVLRNAQAGWLLVFSASTPSQLFWGRLLLRLTDGAANSCNLLGGFYKKLKGGIETAAYFSAGKLVNKIR
ncbi:MAG: hypothetical protein CSB34_03225 [Desulfobulbus propionicus]|nr:MAG: hypothetical protein CSB34_03225 [Desulfobulbus propionicus]